VEATWTEYFSLGAGSATGSVSADTILSTTAGLDFISALPDEEAGMLDHRPM
jgi:hypothetical protein